MPKVRTYDYQGHWGKPANGKKRKVGGQTRYGVTEEQKNRRKELLRRLSDQKWYRLSQEEDLYGLELSIQYVVPPRKTELVEKRLSEMARGNRIKLIEKGSKRFLLEKLRIFNGVGQYGQYLRGGDFNYENSPFSLTTRKLARRLEDSVSEGRQIFILPVRFEDVNDSQERHYCEVVFSLPIEAYEQEQVRLGRVGEEREFGDSWNRSVTKFYYCLRLYPDLKCRFKPLILKIRRGDRFLYRKIRVYWVPEDEEVKVFFEEAHSPHEIPDFWK